MGKQRIPATLLPYSLKHKAGPNELLVDYVGDGKLNRIYVTDKDINFIDITGQLVDLIKHADAKDSTIYIENYGDVNLKEFVNLLYAKSNSTVHMIDIGDEVHYIQKENIIDRKSLQIKNHNIQIYGFDEAPDGTTPTKMGSKVVWTVAGGTTEIAGGDGTSSENPRDGDIYACIVQNVVANKIYLQASLRQKTIYPTKDFKVVLPKTQDEFCQMYWFVQTNTVVPEITFSDNCFWESLTDSKLRENCRHLYKFITYDHGTTWLAECQIYQFNINDIDK